MPISTEELADLARMLKDHEGVRLSPYRDTEGLLTLGVGHCLDRKPISARTAQIMLEDDIMDVLFDLDRALPWWRDLDPLRRRALADMCFQLGIGRVTPASGLLAFQRMLSSLRTGDWSGAYRECLTSTYATQVPARARRIAEILLTGADPGFRPVTATSPSTVLSSLKTPASGAEDS